MFMFKKINSQSLIAGALTLVALSIYMPKPSTDALLNVSESVEIKKVPNVQSASIGLQSNPSKDTKVAYAEASKFAEAFKSYLNSVKVANSEYTVENVSVNKYYQPYIRTAVEKKSDEMFQANVRFKVQIGPNSQSQATLSEILAKSVDLGANQVGSVQYEFEDEKVYYEQLRELGAQAVQKKAKSIANMYGVKLGKITSYNEYVNNSTPYYARSGAVMEMAMEKDESTPIELNPGEETIRMEVNATFRIK